MVVILSEWWSVLTTADHCRDIPGVCVCVCVCLCVCVYNKCVYYNVIVNGLSGASGD